MRCDGVAGFSGQRPPVFLLGLPSGALADILDRRRYFIAMQFWVAAVAWVLCGAVLPGGMTAPLLLPLWLGLTFANGIGLAMPLAGVLGHPAHDVALRERKLVFHTGDAPPGVVRYVVDNLLLNR